MVGLIDQLQSYAGSDAHNLLDGDAKGEAPTEAELSRDYAAPGEPALLPVGITYQGDWKVYSDGISRHVRELASALSKVGVPIWLHGIADTRMLDGELHPEVLTRVGHLRHMTLGASALAIRHAVIHNSDLLLNLLCPRGARVMDMDMQRKVYGATVFYTSWERSTVHPVMVELINRCAQVWVPCKANYQAFMSSGVASEKIRIVPCPYDPASAVCQIAFPRGSREFGYTVMEKNAQGKPKPVWVPVTGKRFYSIGKWESRKNYDALLGAFLLAFTPKDHASLLIKTSGWFDSAGYPSRSDSARKWLDDPRVKSNGWNVDTTKSRVRIVSERLSEERLADLHRRNNIYVACSHAEAWNLPAFDAQCAGNRLVYVGYGGEEEYASAEDIQIPWEFGPVDPAYGWEPGAQWADYKLDDLVEALRLAEPPEQRIHPPEFYPRFGNVPVALRVRDLLQGLIGPEVWKTMMGAGGFG